MGHILAFLGSTFFGDVMTLCTVPLREPSPIAVSPQNLMDFQFGDNSLAVPMREFGYQSGNDPPRLSPVSSSYQSMAPLQNMAYEMSNDAMMQEDTYNSFEQPSLVVNGHYQTMDQQIIQPQQGYFQITEIGAEMAQLQEQQEKLGINNSQRLSELQAQRASILYEALSSQNVGETVLSQVKQVAAAAAPASQPRSTPRSRSGHSSRPTHFESGSESPQYQPQMYLASHNQYPSTSTAQFQEYSAGGNQAQVVQHQQEQVPVRHQTQQRVYRTQNATTTVYHTSSQLPPGTVYVQNVPQAAQAQYASPQPTVGEVVRQQHQLRHVAGAQQMIVQQVAPQQVVVATGGQQVTAGAQIRSQVLQHSPLPAQIVIAPAVQPPPQVVVVAPRPSPAQTAKRLEEKRASRLSRLRNYFENLHESLSNPDTETPFSDLRDVLQRLLPYHAYVDCNYLRTQINLSEQRKRLEKRMRKVFYDEALHGTEPEEQNLLLYLDGEYEKRKLEEEKEMVKEGNIEAFVRDSTIVAALRNSDWDSDAEKSKAASSLAKASSSKSITQQYEYHTFDEVPVAVSPYKSPSPFKSPASSIRSPSPCKSPYTPTYSPRIRARNASQTLQPPSPLPEACRTRSKPGKVSESTASEKSDISKPDPVRPIPPPLPGAGSRRSTPSRRAAEKDDSSSTTSSMTSPPRQASKERMLEPSVIASPGRPSKKEAMVDQSPASTPRRQAAKKEPVAESAPGSIPNRVTTKKEVVVECSDVATSGRYPTRKDTVVESPAAFSPGRYPSRKEVVPEHTVTPSASRVASKKDLAAKSQPGSTPTRVSTRRESLVEPPPVSTADCPAAKNEDVVQPPVVPTPSRFSARKASVSESPSAPIPTRVSTRKESLAVSPSAPVRPPAKREPAVEASRSPSLGRPPAKKESQKELAVGALHSPALGRPPAKKEPQKDLAAGALPSPALGRPAAKREWQKEVAMETSRSPSLGRPPAKKESQKELAVEAASSPALGRSLTKKDSQKEVDMATSCSLSLGRHPAKMVSQEMAVEAVPSPALGRSPTKKELQKAVVEASPSPELGRPASKKESQKETAVEASPSPELGRPASKKESQKETAVEASPSPELGRPASMKESQKETAVEASPSPELGRQPPKKEPHVESSVLPSTNRVHPKRESVPVQRSMLSTPGRLPAKKELLCRARQGVPAEMRSPPAHTSLATPLMYGRCSMEDDDSDGSASPELGIDDVIPAMKPVQTIPSVPKPNIVTSSKPAPPPPPRLPPSRPVPLPPPLPHRKERLIKTPERTSSPVVKQENVKPVVKPEEEKPAERIRFKPQVPRPAPVSPLKPSAPKRDPVVPATADLIGKDVNCRSISNHAEEKVQVSNCSKPPPIRLKLKLGGKEVYIENNENSEKGDEKKQRKHKKKKKERHKEHRGDHPKRLKDKLLSKEHKKHHHKKRKHGASPQEVVAVTSSGVRLKLKFGANSVGSGTPSRDEMRSNESAEMHKQELMEPQPSTSKASAALEASTPRIPRLKIRIGPHAPTVVIAAPKTEPVTATAAELSSKPQQDKVENTSNPTPLINATQLPVEPLAVEFSDDSDTEAERLRCATDKALRGMANLPEITRPSTTILPWSTQQAP
ncbi:unnamed protein product [Heligmosomoides polygyrus]|uniref:GLTSCR1 domain-containing protein n=1 Tax=Heligmosomoides polygyrus TaxID=6339 RepID=A0A183FN37_HELPZ|nr:unnamed protein product [Heligmosomoides polygyrus]